MTGNRKDHIWVWKHKEKEDKVWHITSKGEGGLWRPHGTLSPDRWPPGRCPFRDPRRIRGLRRPRRIRGLRRPRRIWGLRRPWRIRGLRWPWRVAPPPQIFLGKLIISGGRSGGADAGGRSGGVEGELDRASGDEGELDGTSVGQGELDGTGLLYMRPLQWWLRTFRMIKVK